MPASAFAAAIDTLFARSYLGIDDVYRASGANPGTMLRVIVRQPDRTPPTYPCELLTAVVGESAASTACLVLRIERLLLCHQLVKPGALALLGLS